MRIIDRLRIFLILITVQIRNIGFQLMKFKLREEFLATPPKYEKYRKKERTFIKYGELKYGELGKIVVNRNYELIDGYCSYLILQEI